MSQARADVSSIKSDAKTEPTAERTRPPDQRVIQTQPIAAIPGSSEPMKPVKVRPSRSRPDRPDPRRPVRRAGSAGHSHPSRRRTRNLERDRCKAENSKAETERPTICRTAARDCRRSRPTMVPATAFSSSCPLPAFPHRPHRQQWPTPPIPPRTPCRWQARQAQVTHPRWIIQVSALESKAKPPRINDARSRRTACSTGQSFAEPVVAKDDRKLYRANGPSPCAGNGDPGAAIKRP